MPDLTAAEAGEWRTMLTGRLDPDMINELMPLISGDPGVRLAVMDILPEAQ